MQKVFTEGQSTAEARLLTKSGEKIPYYLTGLRMNTGDEAYLVGVGIDITERKRSEETLRLYAERLRVLREIDEAILAAQSPQAIAQAALDHIRQLVPCQRASVTLFDFAADNVTIRTVAAVPATAQLGGGVRATVPMAEFKENETLRQGAAQLVDDIRALTGPGPLQQAMLAEGIRSYVNLPLMVQGELIGSLNLGARNPRAFTSEHMDIACEVAAPLSIALRQARLSEAEVQRRREAEALRDIAAALSSTLNLEEVWDRILANAGQVVPHEAANIMLIEDGVAQIVRSRGYAERGLEEAMQAMRFTVADMPGLRQMAESGQPLAFPDTQDQSEWIDFPEAPELRSYTAAPIRRKGKVIGFLNLDSSTPGYFNSTHAIRLQAFADQAAVAIENARLHEQVQRHAEELEQRVADRTRELSVLYDVATVASEGLDLQRGLARSLERVLVATGSDAGAIYILDEEEETLRLAVQQGIPADLVAHVESIP